MHVEAALCCVPAVPVRQAAGAAIRGRSACSTWELWLVGTGCAYDVWWSSFAFHRPVNIDDCAIRDARLVDLGDLQAP